MKQVSCLLHMGLFSDFTFIVLINLNVLLFLEDLRLGGDGGGVDEEGALSAVLVNDGAERLKFANILGTL